MGWTLGRENYFMEEALEAKAEEIAKLEEQLRKLKEEAAQEEQHQVTGIASATKAPMPRVFEVEC